MAKNTMATLALMKAGIKCTPRPYDYDAEAERIGMQAAEALGEPPARTLKTLMVLVDGKPACVVIPSDKELAMKKVAAAFDGKAAEMMKPAEAEKLTGYRVGGISPFGQKKKVPTAIEAAALAEPYVLINGGARGLLLQLSPDDALKAADGLAAALVA
jgi:Cys-tRNA(Pro)/Cys-tRNA(Cys) deacylase